jgi:peptidoglycan/LPS O-acetylase OafA/YrhL
MSVTQIPFAPSLKKHAALPEPSNTSQIQYNVAIGYLRAFVTVLVLAHHAALAYHGFAPAPSTSLVTQPRLWAAFPVVDAQRWSGFTLLVGFNDTFFMSLMFLLSGLFVWKSLQRKGSGAFLRDRTLRLGLPFIVAAALVAPLAYYPAYLQTGHRGLAGFWQQWISLGNWPAGPVWFVWVLLAFDCVATGLFKLMPKWGEVLGRLLSRPPQRPIAFFASLVGVSAAAYIPLALVFNPFRWTEFGPFFFQTSRILHYLVYFLIGVGIGAVSLERGLLARDGKLARRWPLWAGAALFAFGLAGAVFIVAISAQNSPYLWGTLGGFTFTLSCAASSMAFLALFVRFAKPRKIFDSLRENAYGIYLIHYAVVSWLQYALLKAQWPAIEKGFVVLAGALAVSWVAIAAIRRVPAVARVI